MAQAINIRVIKYLGHKNTRNESAFVCESTIISTNMHILRKVKCCSVVPIGIWWTCMLCRTYRVAYMRYCYLIYTYVRICMYVPIYAYVCVDSVGAHVCTYVCVCVCVCVFMEIWGLIEVNTNLANIRSLTYDKWVFVRNNACVKYKKNVKDESGK